MQLHRARDEGCCPGESHGGHPYCTPAVAAKTGTNGDGAVRVRALVHADTLRLQPCIMDADAKKLALRMIPYGLYVLTAEAADGSVAAATVN